MPRLKRLFAKKQLAARLKIVAIRPQRRQQRFNLYLSNDEVIGVGTQLLADFRLQRGQSLSLVQLKKIRRASWQEKSYQRALRWLALRPRAEKEIKDRLTVYLAGHLSRREQEKVIKGVLGQLRQQNLLDDEKFARWWREQKERKLVSRRAIERDLYRYGIAASLIKQTLADYPEKKIGQQLLKKRKKRLKNIPKDRQKQRLWLWLKGRGFQSETIRILVDDFFTDGKIKS